MAVIDLKSAYTQALTQYDKDKNKIADWEDALAGLQSTYKTAYESEAAPIKTQAAYDISQAYENYKKTQLNLLQNQQLGSGFREALGSELSSEYEKTYSDIRKQETKQLSTIGAEYTKQYLKDYEDKVKELEKEASNLAALEKSILTYGGIDSAEAEKLGYYKQNQQGVYELTNEGRDFFAKSLLQANDVDGDLKHFGDYLYEANPTLYEYYSGNVDKIATLVGGLEAEDIGKSYADSSAVGKMADVAKADATAKYSTLTQGQKEQLQSQTGKTFDEIMNAKYTTHGDRRNAYEEYVAKMSSLPTDIGGKSGSVIKSGSTYTYRNETYTGTYVGNSSKTANQITADLNLKKRIKSGEIAYGDVVEWKGSSYIVEKSDSKIPSFTKLTKK